MSVSADLESARLSVLLDLRNPFSYLALQPAIEFASARGIALNWLPLETPPLRAPSQPAAGDDRGARHRRYRAQAIAREVEVYSAAQGIALRELYRDGEASAANQAWLWVRERHADTLEAFLVELFRRYWALELDPADPQALRALLDEHAADGAGYLAWSQREGVAAAAEIAGALRNFGLFQVPAYVVGDEVFYGRQHLPMITGSCASGRGPFRSEARASAQRKGEVMLPADLPRVRIAHLPTPIDEMPRLARELGGPRLFAKRDDCTGLAMGGNKTRKLEFLVGHALEQGADTLITEGGVQSNHCRQTAAAANHAGLECVLVLNEGFANELTGNLFLDHLLGARVVTTTGARADVMNQIAADLTRQGKRPYVIPTGGSNGVGAMGYAEFMFELAEQTDALGDRFDVIVTASGSGGTQGGLVLGKKLLSSPARIIGISDGETRAELAEMVLRVARDGAALLGAELEFHDEELEIYDQYYGQGYGVPTPEMIAAVRQVARCEGLLLDPVYNGKAMAGLIDLIARGQISRDQNVLFIHTGGTPALFAYREIFTP